MTVDGELCHPLDVLSIAICRANLHFHVVWADGVFAHNSAAAGSSSASMRN